MAFDKNDEQDVYVLLMAKFMQGDMYHLQELAKFDNLAEAQAFYKENTQYRTNGHMWGGMTRYQLAKRAGDDYEPISDEKHISFGAICEPNPTIIRLD